MAANTTVSYYVTSFQITNFSATSATVSILDGANTLFCDHLPAGNVPYIVFLPIPLRGTVNNAINLQVTPAANVYYNFQGFIGGF